MFSNKFKNARLNKNLKQSELARLLNIKNTTISNWEKGLSKPDFDTIEKLCQILEVDANYFCECSFESFQLSLEEQALIQKYRMIEKVGQEMINFILNKEVERLPKEEPLMAMPTFSIPQRYIDCYPRLASCGSGEYLFDGIPNESIAVAEDCPADFAIGVNGHSMEPTYYDGEILLIKKQEQINLGENGLFIIDGEAYVKELGKKKLLSHNPDYPDIPFKESMNILCVGKVIGSYDKSLA